MVLGAASLVIPAEAVDPDVTYSLTIIDELPPKEFDSYSLVYKCEPDGLSLKVTVTVSIYRARFLYISLALLCSPSLFMAL